MIGMFVMFAAITSAEASTDRCGGQVQDAETGVYYRTTSLIRLLSAPTDLIDCPVITVGILDSSGKLLYVSEEDRKAMVVTNSIALTGPFGVGLKLDELDGRRVIVRGVFGGRVDMCEGSLRSISDLRFYVSAPKRP